ncbi:MAG: HAD-IA family hydrolase [Lachnospiraceae bacterium]|nr:HAD-IA family hydrolase [Lachnospiraceae bacterium]
MSTKAVIFDLDDTLISEVAYAESGYRTVASVINKKYGLDKDAVQIFEELLDLFNTDHKNVFNRFLKDNGLSDDRDSVMELVEAYREHLPEIDYFGDVRPALEGLKNKKIITGILSDGYSVTQRQKVRALGAENDFDIIILTDDLGRDAWKPSPRGFQIIEDRYKLSPDEILYVGDNPKKDFYLSRSAGIKTARVKRKKGVYNNESYFENVKEDYSIDSLLDLIRITE